MRSTTTEQCFISHSLSLRLAHKYIYYVWYFQVAPVPPLAKNHFDRHTREKEVKLHGCATFMLLLKESGDAYKAILLAYAQPPTFLIWLCRNVDYINGTRINIYSTYRGTSADCRLRRRRWWRCRKKHQLQTANSFRLLTAKHKRMWNSFRKV